MNRGLIPWFSLAVIWGSTFIFMKWATAYISPLQVTFVRVVCGLVPVMLYAAIRGHLRLAHLQHWPYFLVMAFIAGPFYFYGFAKGTSLLPSGIAGAVSATIPLASMLAALLFLPEERLTHSRFVGLLVGFAGVIIIARPLEAGLLGTSVAGVAWMVLGSLSLGASFVYARKYLQPLGIPPAALTTYQMGIAALALLLVTDLGTISNIAGEFRALLGLVVGLGIIGTGVAYILYYFIVDRLGAVSASSVTYVSPIVALLIGALLAGESIHALDIAATALILAGVLLINRA